MGIVYKGGLDVVKNRLSNGTTLFEYLSCKVSLHMKQFILCSMYRSPSSKNSDFLNEWNNLLSDLVILPDELILCGDLNLYLDVPSNNNTIQFLQSLDAWVLIQHVKEPTHYQGHTLDVIITRGSNNYIDNINGVDPILCNQYNVILRDHYAIMATMRVLKYEAMRKEITFRGMCNIVLDDFRSDISTIDHLNDTSIDLKSMTVNFNTYLISLLNKHAPLCRKYMRAETKTPWYNNTILTAKRCKRQLERRWRKLHTDASQQAYRVQCIALNKLLYTSRVNYYNDKITEGGHNTKTLCNNDNLILPSHNDPNILANEFSEYFCDKFKEIRDGITIDLSKSPPS